MTPQTRWAPCCSAELAEAAPRLAPSDHAVLETLGRHPFLTVGELAIVLGWFQEWTTWRRHLLIRDGLVRLLDRSEAKDAASLGLTELTADGVRLVASRLGLPVGVAVRHLGLAGGGPEQPIGQRASLLRTLSHTRGVNGLFVGLYRIARTLAARGLETHCWSGAGPRPAAGDGYGPMATASTSIAVRRTASSWSTTAAR